MSSINNADEEYYKNVEIVMNEQIIVIDSLKIEISNLNTKINKLKSNIKMIFNIFEGLYSELVDSLHRTIQ